MDRSQKAGHVKDLIQANEYERFTGLLSGFKMFLNPDLCDKLLFAVNNYVDSIRAEERAKVLSKELQVLEPMLNLYRQRSKDSHKMMADMHLENITKQIKLLYGSGQQV